MRTIRSKAVHRRLSGLSAAAFVVLCAGTCAAAHVSQEFLGTFVIPPEQQGDPLSCGRDGNDGAMDVGERSVGYFEHRCDVSAFRRLKSDARSAEVLLSCSGEGNTWRTREIWNLQGVESRTMLVATRLQVSKPQPERKRSSGRMHDEIRVTLYTKCPAAR
jgi:hypothetical protein